MTTARKENWSLGEYAVTTVEGKWDWLLRAACRELQSNEIFFPESMSVSATKPAKEVCKRCPVKMQCLGEFMYEVAGVWGGYGVKERKKLAAYTSRGMSLNEAISELSNEKRERKKSDNRREIELVEETWEEMIARIYKGGS